MDKLFVKIHTGDYHLLTSTTMTRINKSQIDTHLTMGVSNFLRDLFETSFAVAGATSRSLVLIDEFGIGTNEVILL
jgi:DNA mismatch repair ATPase MutS